MWPPGKRPVGVAAAVVREQKPRRGHTIMRRLLIAAALAAAATMTLASSAFAFKPYTHVQSGLTARADAVDDGKVTIGGERDTPHRRGVAGPPNRPRHYKTRGGGPPPIPPPPTHPTGTHPPPPA